MLIKGGTVHTGSGEILSCCDVLIQNGIIKKAGRDIVVPGEMVIDASSLEIFPGFIDPVNYLGCIDMAYKAHDADEISEPVTPDVSIKHSFDPDEMTLQHLYKSGITSVGTSPGNMNVIGGQTAVLKTWGHNVNRMLVRECNALKGSVINLVRETYGGRGTAPNSRMAVIQMLKEAFERAESAHGEEESFRIRCKNEVLKKVIAGIMPFIIAADTKAEIESVVEALKDFKNMKLIFCNAYQAGKASEAIKKANAGIIIGELSNSAKEVYYETDLREIVKLHSEGIPVGISLLSDDNVYGRETYFWTVSKLRKAGANCDEVLSMMTREPAEMLNVYDRIGSIEEGKDGDVVIFDKNPLKYCDAFVTHTIIRGEVVYEKGGASCC